MLARSVFKVYLEIRVPPKFLLQNAVPSPHFKIPGYATGHPINPKCRQIEQICRQNQRVKNNLGGIILKLFFFAWRLRAYQTAKGGTPHRLIDGI